MPEQPVGNLAADAGHDGADRRDQYRSVAPFGPQWAVERRHRDPVDLAGMHHGLTSVGGPDGSDRLHVLAHLRGGLLHSH